LKTFSRQPTNQRGIFCHQYSVTFEVKNDDEGGDGIKKKTSDLFVCHHTNQGKTIYPRKSRVAGGFKDEDEMDHDRIVRGLKKRKRAKDQVDQRISATTKTSFV
jgi:hypothetical protein